MSEQTQALKHLNAYLDAIDEIATIGAAPKEHTGQAVMGPPYHIRLSYVPAGLLRSLPVQSPAPVSPVEPTPEPPIGRQAQTDPWAQVKRFHVSPRPDDPKLVRHVDPGPGQPEGFYMWADNVDAARAADAAQIVAWRKWADNAEAQIASLTAQLDQKTAEVEMLRGVGCNEDGDGPCGACLKCARAERDAAQQEAQTLRVALVELVDATDDADNARDQGVSSSDAVMTRARAALAPRPQEPQ